MTTTHPRARSTRPSPDAEITRLRRQVADLAEERDLLVRQLVAIRTMITAPGGFYVAELQRILDGAAR